MKKAVEELEVGDLFHWSEVDFLNGLTGKVVTELEKREFTIHASDIILRYKIRGVKSSLVMDYGSTVWVTPK